jgi:hypothetical protein
VTREKYLIIVEVDVVKQVDEQNYPCHLHEAIGSPQLERK